MGGSCDASRLDEKIIEIPDLHFGKERRGIVCVNSNSF